MTSPAITNSLLRVDRVTGSPPAQFKRPNGRMDFFVLELGESRDVPGWCARTEATVRKLAAVLRQMRAAGAELTLFVESAAAEAVLRLDASFLSVLAEAGVSLECSREPV